MPKPRRISIALYLVVMRSAFAAEPDFSQGRVWRPGEEILALAQTSEGFLWVGTRAGLLRFDGREFQRAPGSPGPGRAPVALLAGREGALWAAFEGPPVVMRFSPGGPAFWGESQGMTPGRVRALADDGAGGIWVGGDRGVFSIAASGAVRRAAWTPSTGLEVRALHRGDDGTLWVGTEEGLGCVRGDRFHLVWAQGPVSAVLPLAPTRVLVAIASRGGMGGLHALSLARDRAPRAHRLYNERTIRTLEATGDGGAWVGTSGGLLRVEPAATTIDARDRLDRGQAPSQVITSLHLDREGSLWVGTPLGLMQAPPPRSFHTVSTDGKRQVLSVLPGADGSVWLLGPETLQRWRDEKVVEEVEVDAPDGLMGLVEDEAGTLWVGSRTQGLFRYQRGRLDRFPLPGPAEVRAGPVRPLLASSRHGLLVAVGDGMLAVIQRGALEWRTFTDVGVRSELVGAVEDERGALWLASSRHGLLVLDGLQRQRVGRRDGLPSENLTSILRGTAGQLWLGTRDVGLVHAVEGRFVALGRREGLGTSSIAGMVADGRGYLWLTTTGDGVVRAREAELSEFVAGRRTRVTPSILTARDGLPANGGALRSPPAGAVDARGRLWLALQRGAVVFPDPAVLGTRPLPLPIITSVKVDGRPLPIGGPTPEVPAGNGLLEVRYTAPLFEGRQHLRFRYWLDGVDRTPHEAGDGQDVVYARLRPGTYRFRVRPSFSDGSGTPAAKEAGFTFVLAAPFHRTGSFYALLSAAAVLVVVGAGVLRMRVVRRRRALIVAERDRIARDIHDSLEQTLYAAKFQLAAAMADPTPSGAAPNIARAAELLGRGIEETRAAVWALRTGIFGRAELPVAISVTAGESLRGSAVTFALEVDGTPYRLPGTTEWQIGQAVREAFTNALKHAQPRALRVRIAFEPTRLLVVVSDDGAGFSRPAMSTSGSPDAGPGGHYGLRGMRERLRACGGRVTLDSALGQGTTVRIEVPKKGAYAA